MELNEYIESGILELYVFGKTTDAESEEVQQMAAKHVQVRDEILSIEKAVISLSFSMSPYLSAGNFEKIRQQLLDKHGVVQMRPRSNTPAYIGWAAAVLLMLGMGYEFMQLNQSKNDVIMAQTETSKVRKDMAMLDQSKKHSDQMLAVVRDDNNMIVPLAGQTVAPDSKAKVYWNKSTQTVYIDASGLPEPPEGKVYQVWSLILNPLTPTSIGLLDDFKGNETKMFSVQSTLNAQGFGITLEPAGGSATPTMDQLYTLGAIPKTS